MRPIRLALAAGVVALAAAPAFTQDAGVASPLATPPATVSQPAKNGNAAVDYWRAASFLDRDFGLKISKIDWNAIGANTDLNTLPAEFKDAVKEIPTNVIAATIRGSRTPRCDFQVEYDLGPFALLPHLSKLREVARTVRFDARYKLASGNPVAAAEDLAAIVRMGGHLGNDHLLISSLVAGAVINFACQETQAQLQSGKLTPDAKAVILTAMNTLDHADPCSIKPCIRGEQRWGVEWIKAHFRGDTAGRQLIASGFLAGEEGGAEKTAAMTIAVMNGDQLSAACDLLNPYYDQVAAAWDKPDASEQLKRLWDRAGSGDFGPLGTILAPAFTKAFESARRIQNEINKTRDLLAAK